MVCRANFAAGLPWQPYGFSTSLRPLRGAKAGRTPLYLLRTTRNHHFRRTAMKQTITYLRLTGRQIVGFIKKLIGKAKHQGTLKIGVTIGFPPLFAITLSYDVKFNGRADNDNRKVAKTG